MSSNHSSAKKLVHITEESLPPVYVPIVLGNDYYVMTQQDLRRMEETRFLRFNKLYPNGDLYPLQPAALDIVVQLLKQCHERVNCPNSSPTRIEEVCCPQPMEVSSTGCLPFTMAVEEQLKWAKCNNTSAPYPFTYSRGTSTTELSCSQPNYTAPASTPQRHICGACDRDSPKKVTFSSGTNTIESKFSTNLSAREQLKQKKIINSYIS